MLIPALLLLLAASPLGSMTSTELDAYLKRKIERDESFSMRLGAAAIDAVGTPYHDGPLGEGPKAKYDTDPLIDLSRVDCVTFVEQCIALAAARSGADFVDRLQCIRYKDGRIDYESRNHFLITDWVASNPWCADVTGTLGVSTEEVTRTISRKGFFERVKAPGLGLDAPDRRVTVKYVPLARAADVEAALPSPSLVVFVGNVDWLFALHCGLYLREDSGAGRLYHASSKAGAVVSVPLAEYAVENSSRYRGFTVYTLAEPPPCEPVYGTN